MNKRRRGSIDNALNLLTSKKIYTALRETMSTRRSDEHIAKRQTLFMPIPESPTDSASEFGSQVEFIDAETFESSREEEGEEYEHPTTMNNTQSSDPLSWNVVDQEFGSRTQADSETFGLDVLSGHLEKDTLSGIEKIIVKRNDNIKRKLNYLFNKFETFGNDDSADYLDFLFIAKNDSVQKLLTITEIIKQKIESKGSSHDRFGDRKVKTDDYGTIDVKGNEIKNLKIQYYSQFNYLDYSIGKQSDLLKKPKQTHTDNSNHTEKKSLLNQKSFKLDQLEYLHDNKEIKVPILYIYFCAHKNGKKSEIKGQLEARFKFFKDNSWTQQS